MRVAVVRFGGEPGAMAGRWLAGAAGVLALLAAAAAAVSWQAQYMMVRAVKHAVVVAAIEAGIPGPGAQRGVHRDLAGHERAGGRTRMARPGDLGDARRGVRAGLGHADRRGP